MSKASWFNLYEYKDSVYRVIYFTVMKCPQTGNWLEAVLYENQSTRKIYCRELKDFEEKFKNV